MSIDGAYPLERSCIDHDIGQGVEIMHRSTIAHLWAFNPQRLGLTVDPFGCGTLPVNALILLSLPIQGNPHFATHRDVDVFDTAHAFGKLLVVAALPTRAGP